MLVGDLFGRRQWVANFLPQPLGRAPDAGRPAWSLQGRCRGKSFQRQGSAQPVAHFPADPEALCMHHLGSRIITLAVSDIAEVGKRGGNAPAVTQLAPDRQALLK